MDSSSNNMTMDSMMMVPWLHFTGGDNLYFKSLRPTSHGAIAGACIVLALLAIFDRWVAAMRGVAQVRWAQRYVVVARGLRRTFTDIFRLGSAP